MVHVTDKAVFLCMKEGTEYSGTGIRAPPKTLQLKRQTRRMMRMIMSYVGWQAYVHQLAHSF